MSDTLESIKPERVSMPVEIGSEERIFHLEEMSLDDALDFANVHVQADQAAELATADSEATIKTVYKAKASKLAVFLPKILRKPDSGAAPDLTVCMTLTDSQRVRLYEKQFALNQGPRHVGEVRAAVKRASAAVEKTPASTDSAPGSSVQPLPLSTSAPTL